MEWLAGILGADALVGAQRIEKDTIILGKGRRRTPV